MNLKFTILLIALNSFFDTARSSNLDACESNIKSITNDLSNWIKNDYFKDLKLPENISVEDYKKNILNSINNLTYECVNEPLAIKGLEKTCINIDNHIKCDTMKFINSPISIKYKLIHHELAGISGFESNINNRSNYAITNQLDKYFNEKNDLKLGIKINSKSLTRTLSYKNNLMNKNELCSWAELLVNNSLMISCLENNLTCFDKFDNKIQNIKNECTHKKTVTFDILPSNLKFRFMYENIFEIQSKNLKESCETSEANLYDRLLVNKNENSNTYQVILKDAKLEKYNNKHLSSCTFRVYKLIE